MDVLAASENRAICRWEEDGVGFEDVFEVRELVKAASQQQQQPQPPDPGGARD